MVSSVTMPKTHLTQVISVLDIAVETFFWKCYCLKFTVKIWDTSSKKQKIHIEITSVSQVTHIWDIAVRIIPLNFTKIFVKLN